MANNPQEPRFLIEVAIEPVSPVDRERLHQALTALTNEDPTFSFGVDQESGQAILKGDDERRLHQKIDQLVRTTSLQVRIGAPQVAYRESLGRRAEIDHTHKKQTDGASQFARVKLVFEPTEAGSGFVFESTIVGGAVPKEYIPGVQKGIESAKDDGLLAGFPVIDFKATLIDGAFHDVDSSVLAFEIASRAAFRELREKASPKLLEPIMKVEVLTADDYLATVLADLRGRRGEVGDVRRYGSTNSVSGFVPLAEMLGYPSALLVKSEGRAQARLAYSHYSPVPRGDEPNPSFPGAMAMRA